MPKRIRSMEPRALMVHMTQFEHFYLDRCDCVFEQVNQPCGQGYGVRRLPYHVRKLRLLLVRSLGVRSTILLCTLIFISCFTLRATSLKSLSYCYGPTNSRASRSDCRSSVVGVPVTRAAVIWFVLLVVALHRVGKAMWFRIPSQNAVWKSPLGGCVPFYRVCIASCYTLHGLHAQP